MKNQIHFLEPSPLIKEFAWNNDWIVPFESPWGIFEKFKYANRIKSQDIFNLFGTQHLKKLKSTTKNKSARNLITLEGLDNTSIIKILNFQLKRHNEYIISKLTNVLPGNQSIYFHKHLRFCPKCIKQGYHSIYHQFKLMHLCPFHMVPLTSECPKCKMAFRYEITDSFTLEPFRCDCGYYLFSPKKGKSYSAIWKKNKKLKVTLEILMRWEKMNSSSIANEFHIHYHPEIDLTNYQDAMAKILEAADHSTNTEQGTAHNIIKSTPLIRTLREEQHYRFIKRDQTKSIEETSTYDNTKEIFRLSKATLNSLNRHLEKSMYKHKKCIKNCTSLYFLHSPKINWICPAAYAYVFWQVFIKAELKFICNNDERRRYNLGLYHSNYDFTHSQDITYIRDLYWWLDNHCDCKSSEINWVLKRVLIHLKMNHFNNWTRISIGGSKERHFYYEPPFKLEGLPFYLILIPKDKSLPLEFHFWEEEREPYLIIHSKEE